MSQPFPREAMLLAAGKGERLRPWTKFYPKPLLPLANIPMIEIILRDLKALGVERFIINLHHLGNKLQAYLGDGKRFGVDIVYSLETELLGTGGGIKKMLPLVQDEYFVCLNGDSLQFADLQKAWQAFATSETVAGMVLIPANKASGETQLEVAVHDELPNFVKTGLVSGLLNAKQLHDAETSRYISTQFTGTHFFNRDFLKTFFLNRQLRCIIREGYVDWLKAGTKIAAYVEEQPLLDTGTLERFLGANAAMLQRLKLPEPVLAAAKIIAPVCVGKKVVIETNRSAKKTSVTIGPNVSIGDGCHIESGARLSNCVILPNCRIAKDQIVENTILMPELN